MPLASTLGWFVVAIPLIAPAAPVHGDQLAQRALTKALQATRASGVVVDLESGATIASIGNQPQGTPGSTLKPLLLQYALDHNIVTPQMQVYCRRDLHVGSLALPCTHPDMQPVFDAESALAQSCNTWFAELARRYTSVQLDSALLAAQLRHAPMRQASVEERQLTVLGVSGVTVTPLELARTYRNLLLRIPADGVVARGLRESVDFGMANPAHVPDITILGKTGTASNPGKAWTHGWFAGAMPGRFVVAIYVPHGDGGTAARFARTFFRAMAERPGLNGRGITQ